MKSFQAHITIIIPAYKESKNLGILLSSIFSVIPSAFVIIVDDSVGEEATATDTVIKHQRQQVMVIHRKGKGGRGSAVIDGMREALKDKRTDIIIEMDADLAHDPREIPRLLNNISTFDMVIGSRYINGSTIVDWPISRLIQSKIINFVLKYWLGLNITDYTNGFRAYTRNAVVYLTSITLHEKGFISLSEVAYALRNKGFRISEVPITFTDRKYGTSNAGIRELTMSLVGAIRIRLRKSLK